MHRLVSSLLAALALALSVHAGPPDPSAPKTPRPAVFSDKSYADALAATKGTTKILIVKGTASWCAPCKMMDRTTFVDENVIKWFGDNGLIVDLDVDEHAETAQNLNIRAMPTMIAFKNGQEVDRIQGYRNGESFLNWLNDVKAGKRSGEDLQVKIEKAAAGDGNATAKERFDNFRNLLSANRDLDKATDEAVWLWQNMHKLDPSLFGVRSSFFASDIGRLIKARPEAGERFTKIRDEAWTAFEADKDLAALSDWAALNDSLGQTDRTLAWFDKAKGDPKNTGPLRRLSFRLERLLTEQGRVADICLVYPDPIQKLRDDDEMRKMLPKLSDAEQDKAMRDTQNRMFRDAAGKLYASLLLAKRESDAGAFLAEATKLDDTAPMRLALVQAAVDAKAGHKSLFAVLNDAEKAGTNVEAVRAALEEQAGKP